MSHPALRIEGLRATVDPAALHQRRLVLAVEGGVLRLSTEGVSLLLPPGVPIRAERITGGRLVLSGSFRGFTGTLELRPSVSPLGGVRLTVEGGRAGFLPLPVFLVTGALRYLLPQRPELLVTDEGYLELDLAALVGRIGIELPALRSVRMEEGLVQLAF